jgi:hypothetical protein
MLKTSASTRFPDSLQARGDLLPPLPRAPRSRSSPTRRTKDNAGGGGRTAGSTSPGPLGDVGGQPARQGQAPVRSRLPRRPERRAAKYECKPTRAIDAYFRNMQAIRRPASPRTSSRSRSPTRSGSCSARSPVSTAPGWEPIFHIDWDQLQPIQGANYAMHADLAMVGDRAGIAMSHVKSLGGATKTEYVENEYGEASRSEHRARAHREERLHDLLRGRHR